jgi:hypothetical protein
MEIGVRKDWFGNRSEALCDDQSLPPLLKVEHLTGTGNGGSFDNDTFLS